MDGRWYHGFDLHFLMIAMAGTLSHTCWPFVCLFLDVCLIPLPVFNLVVWFCCCCCRWRFSLWFFHVKIWCAPTESWGAEPASPTSWSSACTQSGAVHMGYSWCRKTHVSLNSKGTREYINSHAHSCSKKGQRLGSHLFGTPVFGVKSGTWP